MPSPKWTKSNGQLFGRCCEICGFVPSTKNKYREKQDHLVNSHFKAKIDSLIPTIRPWIYNKEYQQAYKCPGYVGNPDLKLPCDYIGKDRQNVIRHYTGKHNVLEDWIDSFFRQQKPSEKDKIEVNKVNQENWRDLFSHGENSLDNFDRSKTNNDGVQLVEIISIDGVNNSSLNVYKCDKCEKSFISKDLLRDHIKHSHIEPPIQRVSVIQKVANTKIGSSLSSSINDKIEEARSYEPEKNDNDIYDEVTLLNNSSLNKIRIVEATNIENNSLKVECSYCHKFVGYRYIEAHKRRHRGEGSQKCQICERCFQYPSELKIHYKTHDTLFGTGTSEKSDETKNYEQEKIDSHIYGEVSHLNNSSFNKIQNVEAANIQNNSSKVQCSYMNTKFSNAYCYKFIDKRYIEAHMRRHRGEGSQKCEICGKCFKYPSELKIHYKTHDTIFGTGNSPIGLVISSNLLSREEIREDNADEINLGDLNLDKLLNMTTFMVGTFQDRIEDDNKDNQEVHKIVRATVGNQHLVLTNISMNNLTKLEKIMKENLEDSYRDMILEDYYDFICDSGVTPEMRVLISLLILKNAFVCSYVDCRTTSRERSTMAVHYMSHMGIKPVFKCDWKNCEKNFSEMGALKTHKKLHDKLKKFPDKCDWEHCEKTFSEIGALRKHKMIHVGHFKRKGNTPNQFVCISCGESFRLRGNLQKHMINHQEPNTTNSLLGQDNLVENEIMETEETVTSDSIFSPSNELEYGTNEWEKYDELNASPRKIDWVCSLQNCGLLFSSEWKLNMHKMSDH